MLRRVLLIAFIPNDAATNTSISNVVSSGGWDKLAILPEFMPHPRTTHRLVVVFDPNLIAEVDWSPQMLLLSARHAVPRRHVPSLSVPLQNNVS